MGLDWMRRPARPGPLGKNGGLVRGRPGIQKHRPILTDGGGAEKETERKRKDNQA